MCCAVLCVETVSARQIVISRKQPSANPSPAAPFQQSIIPGFPWYTLKAPPHFIGGPVHHPEHRYTRQDFTANFSTADPSPQMYP